MKELVQVNLHGELAEKFGPTWNLDVKSVSEALHAINVNTSRELYHYLITKEGGYAKFEVIINNETFIPDFNQDQVDLKEVSQSQLCVKRSTIKTIDIVPIISGSGKDVLASILGGLLIVVGVVLLFVPGFQPLGVGLIMAGAGLLAAGVISMLSKPPSFDDFREISLGGKTSYLFNGPVNITQEGGPVDRATRRRPAGGRGTHGRWSRARRPPSGDRPSS